jgi:hypothetical protein
MISITTQEQLSVPTAPLAHLAQLDLMVTESELL